MLVWCLLDLPEENLMGKVEREEQDEDWGKKSVKLVLNMQVIGRILCWGWVCFIPPLPSLPFLDTSNSNGTTHMASSL